MKTTIKSTVLMASTIAAALLASSHTVHAAELHDEQVYSQLSDIVIVPGCASFPQCWPEVETSGD
ncbi:hypothetical protein [Pseudoalteromonas ardens]|uniref:Uncharacterized protein n=1 Tax=Pseudoalteromonas rubra TaxID=43658 RepID=A0A0L0EX55_9GAMM|nr:hypothetical protein [Pseudoalteromonas sp. R96]KNC69022.1 hypothetical protein AC626_01465 [Pseudoalteromonas rubra]MDK1313862.1 hypothetical protein [Pseudoalteromonas sp. R96]